MNRVWLYSGLAIHLFSGVVRPEWRAISENVVILQVPVKITIRTNQESAAAAFLKKIVLDAERLSDRLDLTNKHSLISLINQESGKSSVPIPDDLIDFFSEALSISQKTNGAFDFSSAILMDCWNFIPGYEKIPSPNKLEHKLPLVNFRQIQFDRAGKSLMLKQEKMMISTDDIGVANIIDEIMKQINNQGFEDVDIESDLICLFSRHKHESITAYKKIIVPMQSKTLAVSCLTNERKSFIKDNVRYYPIINPKTGYPARKCKLVIVTAPTSLKAMAFSKALFVLGVDKGMPLVERENQIEAVMIDGRGRPFLSSGLKIENLLSSEN